MVNGSAEVADGKWCGDGVMAGRKTPGDDLTPSPFPFVGAGARSALHVLHLLVHLAQLGEFLIGRLVILARIRSHRFDALGRQLRR